MSKPVCFRISTKIRLGFNITSTKHQHKKLSKLQLQILSEFQLQNFDQTLCSKFEKKVSFLTSASKSVTKCCQHDHYQQQLQHQQVGVGIFTRQGHINEVY